MMKLLEINFPTCEVKEFGISTTYNDVEPLPEVTILDPTFSINESLKILDKFIQQGADVVIFASVAGDEEFVLELLKRPIKGFLLKKMDTVELIRSLNDILEGKKYIHPHIANILLDYYQSKMN